MAQDTNDSRVPEATSAAEIVLANVALDLKGFTERYPTLRGLSPITAALARSAQEDEAHQPLS